MSNWDDVVGDLATRMSVIAPGQFANPSVAQKKLSDLVAQDVLGRAKLSAIVVRSVERIALLEPDDNVDRSERIAADLHQRWSRLSPGISYVYWATARTVHLLGGEMSGRLTQPDALSHNLGLSAVALTLFSRNPALRRAWIPECRFIDVYAQAKPDAALATTGGIECLIEFCGHYSAQRCRALARLAREVDLPIWLFTVSQGDHHAH